MKYTTNLMFSDPREKTTYVSLNIVFNLCIYYAQDFLALILFNYLRKIK